MNSKTIDTRLIHSLLDGQAYPHETATIKLLETHISWILLTGEFAYKIKKPVDFGFLDFSTLEKRRFCCLEELRLNRRFASSLYLDVVSITGNAKKPEMGGTGMAIEYAVKMRQFDQQGLMSVRAENGLLTTDDIDGIASIVSRFHTDTETASLESPYGEPDDIKHWSEENFQHIEPLLDDIAEIRRLKSLHAWTRNEWQQKAELMRQRKRQGFIRECHGDLHLGNIALFDGQVTPFDCIEFNPMLRWIDVSSEIAFIFMDLIHRQFKLLAWRLLNRYLQQTGDYQGLALLRYYLVYRALVRAKVALLRMQQDSDPSNRNSIHAEYQAYADLAERHIQASGPMLLITHGFSGSGKSFFAEKLSEKLGTIHLRSDIERKRLYGFAPQESTNSETGSGIYNAEAGRITYRHLIDTAHAILNEGFSVIVDATFLKHAQRADFIVLAEKIDAPLLILDFKASLQTLIERIESRQQQRNDPSEATPSILQLQIGSDEPLTEPEQNMTIQIDTENESAFEDLFAAIKILKLGQK
ncbi:AAA family ATPase [Methylotuvimicrobium sp. KM1]|uniref:bifunctional aminoglycoside phosphotransferase/ATP-binding protein n=1 Tax=Methylotuvimicrobium sp. KM1 TaxID=3377707 RepID=UPI00384B2275